MKKNIVANIVGRFWGLLSNFLFIPLYISYLGFDSYSVISFTLMIAGIMVILDGGLTATLSREFARKDNGESEKLRTFKNLETLYFIIIGICILSIFLSSGFIAEKWITVKNISPDRISLFLKIISFEVGFQLLFRFYMGGLLGLEKQLEANAFQVGWGILRNGLVIFAIIYVPTLEMFFWWQTISTILFTVLIKIYLDKTILGKYMLHFRIKLEKNVLSKIWKFAGGIMLIGLVAAINTQMDKITISKMLSVESLGYYTLAISLSQSLIVLVNPIATAVLPKFTGLYTNKKHEEAKGLFNKFAALISIIVFGFLANLIFFSKELVWVWTGNLNIAEAIALLVPVVAMAYGMIALQVLPYHVAIANGYTKINNIMGFTSLIVTIPGFYFATKNYGAMGAASVFCGVQLLTSIIYLFLINKKFIGEDFLKMLFRQILIPSILSFSSAFIFSYLFHIEKLEGRILTLVIIGLSTGITLLITTIITIPLQELKKMSQLKKISP